MLSLGLPDERRRPGTKKGMARWTADRAIDVIRDPFGWDAVGYASVMLGASRSVPNKFRSWLKRTCEAMQRTTDFNPRCRGDFSSGISFSDSTYSHEPRPSLSPSS